MCKIFTFTKVKVERGFLYDIFLHNGQLNYIALHVLISYEKALQLITVVWL